MQWHMVWGSAHGHRHTGPEGTVCRPPWAGGRIAIFGRALPTPGLPGAMLGSSCGGPTGVGDGDCRHFLGTAHWMPLFPQTAQSAAAAGKLLLVCSCDPPPIHCVMG